MQSYAIIPPILKDVRHRTYYYDNRNGLLTEPLEFYQTYKRDCVPEWSTQEREIFREKYLQHPKNFSFIATFLEKKVIFDFQRRFKS